MSNIATKWRFKLSLAAVVSFASVSSFAAIDMSKVPPEVAEVVGDINASHVPIAAVAGTSMGVYVLIRVWRLVRTAV